jgi:hypothetical protein
MKRNKKVKKSRRATKREKDYTKKNAEKGIITIHI